MRVIDRLRALGDEGLAELLGERPMLLDHCVSLSRLAGIVDSSYGASEALCHANALELAAAEVIAGLGPLGTTQVAAALGLADDLAAVDAAIARLDRLFLVTRLPDGRVTPSTPLVQQFRFPLDLGRPLKLMLSQFDVATLRKAAGVLGVSTAGSKAALADAVSEALGDEATVRGVLAAAPPGVGELMERLLDKVVVDVGYGRPPPAAAWLLERLMLVRASLWSGPAELPREVALALRGPVLCTVPAAPPPLSHRDVPDVDGAAAHHAAAVVPLLTSLLDALDAEPAKAIQSGELGVRDLRRLAKAADTDEATAGRLLEMAHAAGLVGTVTTPAASKPTRSNRWQPDPPLVEWLPTSGYDTWLASDPGRRWAVLAGAWLDGTTWPSRAGARTAENKTTAAFTRHDDGADAPRLRSVVLGLLHGLGVGRTAPVAQLAAAVAWHRPWSATWRTSGSVGVVEGVLAEAELLGVVAGGALSSLGGTLLDDRNAAAALAQTALPTPGRQVVLQADLTAIAAGPLERDVAEELSAMADIESRGAATIWRISDASVRRCLDHGGSADRMLAFLEQHAAKGVPQPLRYLVTDAARRHGNLRVAAAASVITSEDPALLAEVRAARKTAKLKLRELAPTVLASPRPPGVVLETLRAAGFLPAEEGPDGAIALARKERRRAPGRMGRAPAEADVEGVAKKLLADRPARASAPAPVPARSDDDLVELGRLLAGLPSLDAANGWADDEDDDLLSTDVSAHDLLAEAAENDAEVVVFTAAGRRGREVIGTVAMLTENAVVIRGPDGRKKPVALDSILSIMECP